MQCSICQTHRLRSLFEVSCLHVSSVTTSVRTAGDYSALAPLLQSFTCFCPFGCDSSNGCVGSWLHYCSCSPLWHVVAVAFFNGAQDRVQRFTICSCAECRAFNYAEADNFDSQHRQSMRFGMTANVLYPLSYLTIAFDVS